MSVLERAVYQYSRLTAPAQLDRINTVVTAGNLGAIGGSQVPELEQLAAARIGRIHALATSSATSGLEVVLRALGLRPGDQVIIPALGWVSVGAAVTATGGCVRVAPVGAHLTPTWAGIESLIGADTAVVIIAHLRGMPAPDILRTASELRRRDISFIEDCAQAWGVRGAGTHATAAVFSLQTYKLIAAGEGGLVLCDDEALASRMRALSGDTRISTSGPIWRGNARMSEITAAQAIPQLAALDDLIAGLRPLQRQATALLNKCPAVEAPLGFGCQDGNGSHAGAWFTTSEAAHEAWASLSEAGLRAWHPNPGDLHTSDAWPTQPASTSADLTRYLDLQIPFLDPADHPAFLDVLQKALKVTDGARP